MVLETRTDTLVTPTTDWYRVTVAEMTDGEPFLLSFYSCLTSRNGTKRRIGQVVRVLDDRLRQRLCAEVKPGDDIRVFTEMDNDVADCPTFLKDFCKV